MTLIWEQQASTGWPTGVLASWTGGEAKKSATNKIQIRRLPLGWALRTHASLLRFLPPTWACAPRGPGPPEPTPPPGVSSEPPTQNGRP